MTAVAKAKLAARDLMRDATSAADAKLRAVRVHAKLIGDYMAEFHGGDWKVDIDHEAGFVLVRPVVAKERRASR